ncbi:site-2 protease family protein [bacterium]|nr:site-2 protease family protein [bacterium]
MFEILASVFYFVVLLGLCVLVHEWGHYIAAVRAGVRVERFSIGLGKPFFSWHRHGTEFCLAPIPLGGYVKMAGDNPEEAHEGNPWEFFSAAIWRRTLIVLAGPGMNIVTAFVVFFLVAFAYGEPYNPPVVGHVARGGAAEAAGLAPGDLIVSVEGVPVRTDAELVAALPRPSRERFEMVVERDGAQRALVLDYSRQYPEGPFVVPSVLEAPGRVTPAQRIGLATGDTLLAVDGREILSVSEMVRVLSQQVERKVVKRRKYGLIGEEEEVVEFSPRIFSLRWRTAAGEVREASVEPLLRPDPDRPGNFVSRLEVMIPRTTDARSGWASPDPNSRHVGSEAMYVLGFSLAFEPIVGRAFQFSPARKLGLARGDRIIAVDGEPIHDSLQLQETVSRKVDTSPSGDPLPRKVEVEWLTPAGEARKGQVVVKLEKVPESERSKRYIKIATLGISFYQPTRRFGALESTVVAWERMVDSLEQMRRIFGGLFTRDVSYRHLAGPVGIVTLAGQFGRRGLVSFFHLIALLNVNLAIINLLPIPILDGGHLLLFAIEKVKRVFTRHGLTVQQLLFAQKVGIAILLPLIVFVFWNDFARMDFFQRLGRVVFGWFS